MKRFIVAAAVAAALPAASQAYTIVTPSCSINTDGWCLGGPNMAGFLAAITNTANFGPGGTVGSAITVVQVDAFNAGTLAGADAVLVPWWNDGQVDAGTIATIKSFFLGGGDLMLLDDDSGHDPIGQALGVPSQGSNGSASNGTSPLFDGPFGTAIDVTQNGNTGYFSAADLAAVNGTVGGTNNAGQATSAYWDDNAYAAGAGRMVMLGDVDMVSDYGSASYAPPNDNGKFALNGVAYLIAGANTPPPPPVPEPSSWALMMGGFAALGLALRRRRNVAVSFA